MIHIHFLHKRIQQVHVEKLNQEDKIYHIFQDL